MLFRSRKRSTYKFRTRPGTLALSSLLRFLTALQARDPARDRSAPRGLPAPSPHPPAARPGAPARARRGRSARGRGRRRGNGGNGGRRRRDARRRQPRLLQLRRGLLPDPGVLYLLTTCFWLVCCFTGQKKGNSQDEAQNGIWT